LIRDGIEGFIVPIRDSEAIAGCLELLHREPARLREMAERARLRAERFSWANYESTLAACVRQALTGS
jgi:glycosyltransferase involved in cell wall biosynthesis